MLADFLAKDSPGVYIRRGKALKCGEVADFGAENARARLRALLKLGKVIKKPCETCGNAKVRAWHADYSRPLEVRWFCKEHLPVSC